MAAALLGTVTPFCSCSSIPLFIGFFCLCIDRAAHCRYRRYFDRKAAYGKVCGGFCEECSQCGHMMAVTTLSLPSLIMLKKAVKSKLLVLFIAVCTVGIITVGYLFNMFSAILI